MGTFQELFGGPPEVEASAPGRVNLIGEHTDYNDGFVLPMPIPQRTRVELALRRGDRVRAFSAELDGGSGSERVPPHEYLLGAEHPSGTWVDFVQGTTRALREAGWALRGFDLRVSSDVPVGAGLSSSAALEIALLRALRSALALGLDDVELALLGQRAEVDFVGAPVGVMDQMASSLGSPGTALFLDTRSMVWQRLPLPPDVELIVISSGITHEHGAGEYRTRRAECDRAAELLGARKLRDVGVEALGRLAALPPPLDRRARHVVTENARVLAAVAALRAGDTAGLGRLLGESHTSMREDFEVSTPEVDLLVSLAEGHPDVLGARLTGGGFGGSIVALVRAGRGRSAGLGVAAEYQRRTGLSGTLLVPSPAAEPMTG